MTTLSKRFLLFSVATVALLSVIGISAGLAFVQLSVEPNGFYWSQANNRPIEFVITARGSDDIPDLSEEAAIRLAFEAWEDVPSSYISFQEETGSIRNTINYRSDGSHLVLFIEDASEDVDGFFANSSALVAVTPVDFYTNGEIADADILFNGISYRFSTDGTPGTYDVQNIATHEVGHFLGLDHSGVFGSTMVPFAHSGEHRLRSLAADDIAGASTLYPASSSGAISGRCLRPGGIQGLAHGHVVALDVSSGRPMSAALTDSDGYYTISGLPSGNYAVYVEPLDGPLSDDNLFDKDAYTAFGTTYLGGNSTPQLVHVSGGTAGIQDLVARTGAGRNITSSQDHTALVGASNHTVRLYGTGFGGGDAIQISGEDIILNTYSIETSGYAVLNIGVHPFAQPGLRNVTIRNGDNLSILTGGIEVSLAAPQASSSSPSSGGSGTTLTIQGNNFLSGANVVVGDTVATNVSVSGNGSQVTARVSAQSGGTKDVVVINPDGQETRLKGAFSYSGSSGGSSGGGSNTSGGSSGGQTSGGGTNTGGSSSGSGGGGGGGGGGCAVTSDAGQAPMALLPLLLVTGLLLVGRRRRRQSAQVRVRRQSH